MRGNQGTSTYISYHSEKNHTIANINIITAKAGNLFFIIVLNDFYLFKLFDYQQISNYIIKNKK